MCVMLLEGGKMKDRKNLSVEPAGKRKLTKKMMVIFN